MQKKGEGLVVVKKVKAKQRLFVLTGIKSALNATEKASQQLFVLNLGAVQLHGLLTEPWRWHLRDILATCQIWTTMLPWFSVSLVGSSEPALPLCWSPLSSTNSTSLWSPSDTFSSYKLFPVSQWSILANNCIIIYRAYYGAYATYNIKVSFKQHCLVFTESHDTHLWWHSTWI